MRSTRLLSAAALATLVAVPAYAGDVAIKDGWFRALPAGLPAGGYFTLTNDGDKDLSLTGARIDACGMVMLHQSVDAGGMGRMEMVHSVAVPAHGSVAFKPGGYHIMCMHPKPAMKPGATVPVTLEFANGSTVSADFAVKDAKGE